MARRRRHEEHENHEAWAIPYGDLVTLLLAFFVVMYAMSSVNEGKYRVLSDSLTEAFHGTPHSPQPVDAGEHPYAADRAAAADAGQSHDHRRPAGARIVLQAEPPRRGSRSRANLPQKPCSRRRAAPPRPSVPNAGIADHRQQWQLGQVADDVSAAMSR